MPKTEVVSVRISLSRQALGAKIVDAIHETVTLCNRPGTAVDIVRADSRGFITLGQASPVPFKELLVSPVNSEVFDRWQYYPEVLISSRQWGIFTDTSELSEDDRADQDELRRTYYTRFGQTLNQILHRT